MPDIKALVGQMSLEEKAALCTGASAWTTTPVERLGVPAMMMTDGPHGVRRVPDVQTISGQTLPATCFPTASCTASTWDRDLIYKMGQAIAEECIALKVDLVLGPGNNIKRTPLGGRNFEYFSEDPFLAGEMAASYIQGVQSKGVGTSLKHFAVNNQEYQRFSISAEVDERSLREIYLAGFETAVKKGKPWSVMCAYNKINGTYCSENPTLLVDILKNEWGFDGLVVSDWGAVHERVASLKGGVDLEMPGPKDYRVKAVVDAVRSGELDEKVLDQAVSRILGIVFKAAQTPKGSAFDDQAHHALARRVAAEGMVLLKNDGILPLKNLKRIAVMGHCANEARYQGGGSSNINPTSLDCPFEELEMLAGETGLTYADGYPEDGGFQQALIDQAVENARAADAALIFIALPASKESEGYDRDDMDLTAQQVALIKAVCRVQPQSAVVLNTGSPVAMAEWIDGTAAVLQAWLMGQAGGGAVADILFGKVNPSGKLAETFPRKLADTPAHVNFPGENGQVHYGEGIFVGYRYYDAKAMPVQFPFGYGGSYTTFVYSSPRLSARDINDVDGLTVSVDVTNGGKMAGKEIVQVYVHDRKSKLVRPAKELKGFAKVELQPGETKTVSIDLDFRAFAYYHPGYKQWVTEDGDFDILIGASSADIRFRETVCVQSSLTLPTILNHTSTVGEWLADPKGKAVLEPMYEVMRAKIGHLMGADESSSQGIGMNIARFIELTPLASILQFVENDESVPADVQVDRMLAQVYQKSVNS